MDITNIQVCNELLARFSTELALGGTGAQAAAALEYILTDMLFDIVFLLHFINSAVYW